MPKRLALTAAIGAALSLGLIATGVAPASAAAANCPSGAACIWGDTLWKTSGKDGALISFQRYIPDYSEVSHKYVGTTIRGNDTASSVKNNGNWERVRFHEHARHGGAYIQLKPGQSDGNMHDAIGDVTKVFYDRISSGYFESFWGLAW
ncbi:peptidase inhibitor family I36 protein [Diaminobutyricibacter sp. McL0608]|uniref:peptidase inhibitor family I36 protein n=1 Tax=Leifsonia sp. McL0608 TaxID=3143537 RepID=UPI0031F32F15